MAECITRITQDIEFDCSNKPIGGIEQSIILINREDVDWGGTVISGNKITSLVLKSGKTGFSVKGKAKHLSFTSKPIIDAEGINGHQHSITLRVYKNDAESYAQIDALVDGASLIAIVERKQKGENNESAFEVLGTQVGLEVSGDSAGVSAYENEGTYLLSLATPEGTKEPKSILKWLETDYATTKTKFDNKLA